MTTDAERRVTDWFRKFVARPQEVIQHLPPRYQWEFTRRHPYYQMLWRVVQVEPDSDDEHKGAFRQIAELILSLIGVGDSTISPDTEWKEFDSTESVPVKSANAVSRVRLKSLVAVLIGVLSRETLATVANQLQRASELDQDDKAGEYDVLQSVFHGGPDDFEGYLPSLMVTLKPTASEKAIAEAVCAIVRRYKAENGIENTRIRTDKFDDYLAAWDQREGWMHGLYCSDQMRCLKEIASDLGLPDATVHDHYRSAFRFITGVEYTREKWFQVVERFRLAGILGDGLPARQRRAGRTRSVGGHSESSFSSDMNFLESVFAGDDDVEREAQLNELFDALRSDEPIADVVRRFQLNPASRNSVQKLRDRLCEP